MENEETESDFAGTELLIRLAAKCERSEERKERRAARAVRRWCRGAGRGGGLRPRAFGRLLPQIASSFDETYADPSMSGRSRDERYGAVIGRAAKTLR